MQLEADPNITCARIMNDFGLKDECNLIPYIEILSSCNWVRTAFNLSKDHDSTQMMYTAKTAAFCNIAFN